MLDEEGDSTIHLDLVDVKDLLSLQTDFSKALGRTVSTEETIEICMRTVKLRLSIKSEKITDLLLKSNRPIV
jgi:hypothetical protein